MSSIFSSTTEEEPIVFGKLVTDLYGSAYQKQSRVSNNYGFCLRTGINNSLHLPCILLSNIPEGLDGAANVKYFVKSNESLLSAVTTLYGLILLLS
jgi:hypothetical protein